VIRITTPDLHYFCREALSNDELGIEVNNIFYEHGHRRIYSKASLEKALDMSMFENILFSSYQDPDSKLGHHDSHAHRFNHPAEISLYCEVTKPA
jgi:hypothetical protein